MAYADYDFYRDTYRGTLSEADFTRLSERASDYIDSLTDYIFRKSGIPDDVEVRLKKACCAVTDVIRSNETGGTKISERVGDYSVSFAETSHRTAEQKLDDALQMYLADFVKAVKWI